MQTRVTSARYRWKSWWRWGSNHLEQPVPNGMSVGVIGVGSMGGAIVERLLGLGYRVAVWDIDRQKMEKSAAKGASPVGSATELISNHDMVIASLPSPKAVEETFLNSPLLQAVRPSSITIDMSTVGPKTSRRVYTKFKERNAHYLDAPVSGGPRRAAAGALTISVGGDVDAFMRSQSLLRLLGEKVFYVGESGSGSMMKLINQLLVFAHSYAAMEALVLSKSLGVDPSKMYEVVTAGSGNSFMFEEMVKLILARKVWGGRTELLIKDIVLTHQMAAEAGIDLRLCSFLKETAERMAEEGFGRDDAVKDFMEYVTHLAGTTRSRTKSP
ncbi:MAG: NAD(P)-dependent oxidoreductase [Nitrososphaerota archaeon]